MQSIVWRSAATVLALLVLVACAGVPRAPQTVAKGELDPREYRYLELPNRMQVLLVSDPDTDKAAASLLVRTGSGDDPATRQGLAHFLEHMLFLGTDRYPDPAEYQAFISAHGGSHNAYTAVDHTNYFFDIEPGSLEAALDRFSRFFVAPVFNPEYVEREMNAVDSEYRMGLKDDARREYDVLREIVQPGHPLGQLAVGNLETLGAGEGDIRADLLAFYERHYSANLMTLVVLGRESTAQLEAMVRARFAEVEDRAAVARDSAPAMFAPGALPLELHIRPEKQSRELTLLFPVPSAREAWAAKPLEYIGNLVGHEGPGSVLSVLKGRGWAEGLGAGAGLDLYGQDAFQVSVKLTREGVAHYREVTALVLEGIAALRERGVEEWRFREQAQLGELAFRFREKGSPTGAVIGLSNALQDYPVQEALRGAYLFRDFDAQLIGRYLGYMQPSNMLLTLAHPDVETDRESRWFATPYRLSRPEPREWQANPADIAALALPKPNEFIPAEVALKPRAESGEVPRALREQPDFRLWHLQDPRYAVPKAAVYLRLLSEVAVESPRNAALVELFTRLVSDQLNEFAYPATLAGLQYGIAPGNGGFTVKIAGYDDRQAVLLDKILHALGARTFPDARFAALKAELMREWGNSLRERPYAQLVDGLGETLVRRNWSALELRDALADQDPAALAGVMDQVFASAALEMLVHGNFRAQEASRIGEQAYAALRAEAGGRAAPASVEVVQLPEGRLHREFTIDHPDSALLHYVQGTAADYAERARVALSAQILSAPFFNELRTERQLGYVVFAQSYPLHRVPGMLLAVQSPGSGPGVLAAEIDAFLQRQVDAARSLPEEEFERHRRALAERLREAPKSLAERSERLWSDLTVGSRGFDEREQVAAEVERISREEWVGFFGARFGAERQRAIALYSRGSAQPAGAVAPVPGAAVDEAGRWRALAKYYRFGWGGEVQDPPLALH